FAEKINVATAARNGKAAPAFARDRENPGSIRPPSGRMGGARRPSRRLHPARSLAPMPNEGDGTVLDYLRRLVPSAGGAAADGELLARFAAARDEAAFEEL